METGALIYLCGMILSASFALDPFLRGMNFSRAVVFMFCLSALVLSTLRVRLSPELEIDPGVLAVILLLIGCAAARGELKLFNLFACMFLISPVILLTALYSNANPYLLGFTCCLSFIPCTLNRPALSMLGAAFSALVAYYLSVLVSSWLPGGAYSVFEASALFTAQAIAVATLFLLHGVYAVVHGKVKKGAA